LAVLDLLGAQAQIVRARLDGDRQAFGPRLAELRDRVRRRQVHDVHRAAGLATQTYEQRDRGVLPRLRARLEPAAIAAGIGLVGLDRSFELGMGEQRDATGAQTLHRAA